MMRRSMEVNLTSIYNSELDILCIKNKVIDSDIKHDQMTTIKLYERYINKKKTHTFYANINGY